MGDTPAIACCARYPAVLALRAVEDRLAVVGLRSRNEGEADALVVERFGHEGGPLPRDGQLLDGRLKCKARSAAHRIGVPQVDLELAAGELVVGGHDILGSCIFRASAARR